MKRRLLHCVVAFGLGLATGSTVQTTQYWQNGCRRGYATAAGRFQREAVREGHGRWERTGDEVVFRWNPRHEHYRPDTPSTVPGLE